jgi:hypothetical protein
MRFVARISAAAVVAAASCALALLSLAAGPCALRWSLAAARIAVVLRVAAIASASPAATDTGRVVAPTAVSAASRTARCRHGRDSALSTSVLVTAQ